MKRPASTIDWSLVSLSGLLLIGVILAFVTNLPDIITSFLQGFTAGMNG